MNILWEELQDGYIDDIKTTMEDIMIFKKWIFQCEAGVLPHMKQDFIKTLDILRVRLKTQRKEYKQRYGYFPKPSQLK